MTTIDTEKMGAQYLQYAELPEENLFIALGKSSPEYMTSLGAKPLIPKKIYELGVAWFNQLIGVIQPRICSHEKIVALAQKSKKIEDAHLGMLVIELIYPVFGPLHTPLIAAIITTRGINFICDYPGDAGK